MSDDLDNLQDVDDGEIWVSSIEEKLKQGGFIGFDELSVWLAYQVNKTTHPPVAMRLEAELREAASKDYLNILRDNIELNQSLFNFLKNYYGVTLTHYLSEEDKSKLLDAKAALEAIEAAPKPNWSYWAQLFTVGIEDAVYLTLDINPDLWNHLMPLAQARDIPDDFIQPKALEAYGLLKLHGERVEVCASHRKSIGGDLPTHGNTQQVYLAQFGAWAKARSWEPPDEFPISLVQEENPLTDYRDSDLYPEELDIAFQAWRAVAVNGQGEGTSAKARLEQWLGLYYPRLSNAAVERIARVANWDKAGGKPKGGEGFAGKGV